MSAKYKLLLTFSIIMIVHFNYKKNKITLAARKNRTIYINSYS